MRWLDGITDSMNMSLSELQDDAATAAKSLQLCPTLCDPMNRSTPGLPVHHQLPEFTQTHVHRVGDAIQPSHPLPSTSPPAPNPSQHQSLSLEKVPPLSQESLRPLPKVSEAWGNPLQYSCLENPRDRGAWWAAIYVVAQSQT